jgi:hypothetical protein
MAARSNAIDHIFILRFWQEPAEENLDNNGHWRARIKDVNSGRQFHRLGIDAVCSLLRSILSSREEVEGGGT